MSRKPEKKKNQQKIIDEQTKGTYRKWTASRAKLLGCSSKDSVNDKFVVALLGILTLAGSPEV